MEFLWQVIWSFYWCEVPFWSVLFLGFHLVGFISSLGWFPGVHVRPDVVLSMASVSLSLCISSLSNQSYLSNLTIYDYLSVCLSVCLSIHLSILFYANPLYSILFYLFCLFSLFYLSYLSYLIFILSYLIFYLSLSIYLSIY